MHVCHSLLSDPPPLAKNLPNQGLNNFPTSSPPPLCFPSSCESLIMNWIGAVSVLCHCVSSKREVIAVLDSLGANCTSSMRAVWGLQQRCVEVATELWRHLWEYIKDGSLWTSVLVEALWEVLNNDSCMNQWTAAVRVSTQNFQFSCEESEDLK